MTALRQALHRIRLLGGTDLAEVRRLVDADPYANATLAARLDSASSLDAGRLGGYVLGLGEPGGLRVACYVGGNVLTVGGAAGDWQAFADRLGPCRRTCSSIIGTAAAVHEFWSALARYWAPARAVRVSQPLLAIDRRGTARADESVRPVRPWELDRYLPAATAMFAEELDLAGAAGPTYRRRLAQLVAAGRVYARFDRRGEVEFKAELVAVSQRTCQVQGVWVRPDLRGHGLGLAGTAAVVDQALRLAPTASLYVNDFNLPARRMYDRLGMRQVGTLATVLF